MRGGLAGGAVGGGGRNGKAGRILDPQSLQSVPRLQIDHSEPGPPSLQTPLLAVQQLFVHTSGGGGIVGGGDGWQAPGMSGGYGGLGGDGGGGFIRMPQSSQSSPRAQL